MKQIRAISVSADVLASNGNYNLFPYLRDSNGDKYFYALSPLHGRSFLIDKNTKNRFVVSKGNGLSYTQWSILNTCEIGDDSLGLLLRDDALRDYFIGKEIESLGVKTNHMECVMELEREILINNTGHTLRPVLLQYDVECPYRIEDVPFMTKDQIGNEVAKWHFMDVHDLKQPCLIAADILLRNLRTLHDRGILHNALTTHNYTWALELLDFELAHSPNYPYTAEDERRHVKDLFAREIIDTYKIIIYIAGVLRGTIDGVVLDSMFADYGFDLSQYTVIQK